jgi:hypothetical protein
MAAGTPLFGLDVSHEPEAQRESLDRPAADAGQCLADDPPARNRSRHHGADRLPYLPRDRDHRLSCEWRRARCHAKVVEIGDVEGLLPGQRLELGHGQSHGCVHIAIEARRRQTAGNR